MRSTIARCHQLPRACDTGLPVVRLSGLAERKRREEKHIKRRGREREIERERERRGRESERERERVTERRERIEREGREKERIAVYQSCYITCQ